MLLVSLLLLLALALITHTNKKAKENLADSFYSPETNEPDYTLYNPMCFSGDNILSYEDENYTSEFGIDVSTFQDDIDWQKVKQAGVSFCFIRIGRRGAQDGMLHIDSEFEQNYQGAIENNIKVGVYFFSQAISEQEAIEEADYVIKLLNGRKLDLPIVYDLEEASVNFTPRTADLDRQQATDNAIAFCEEIKKYNHDAMIYTYLYWTDNYYDMEKLKEYDIWFAQYNIQCPQLTFPFKVWQYSNTGKIPGIEPNVDLDIMFIKKNDQSE